MRDSCDGPCRFCACLVGRKEQEEVCEASEERCFMLRLGWECAPKGGNGLELCPTIYDVADVSVVCFRGI